MTLICCEDQIIHFVANFSQILRQTFAIQIVKSCDTGLLASAMTQKKRRQDPGQEKAKEDKRRRRLAKALKKMEKKERQPKPLSECEVF